MGLFDVLSPFLNAIDIELGFFLPPIARWIFLGALAGGISMVLYWVFSSQSKISKLNAQIVEVRKKINTYQGEFVGIQPLLWQSIGLSLKRVGLSIGPVVLASFPLLFLLVWLSNTYGYETPEPGQIIEVRVDPKSAVTSWVPTDTALFKDNAWMVSWPSVGSEATLVDEAGNHLLTLPLTKPVTIIHEKEWWNALVGNPLGYIPLDSPVDAVSIELLPRTELGIDPEWLGWWETVFFASVIVVSLLIKFACRIQ